MNSFDLILLINCYLFNFNIDIPSVEVGSTYRIAEYGNNVTLDCNFTSFPAHTSVYWQRVTTGITTNITSDYCDIACIDGVTVLNPSLTIIMAKTADSGLYTCYITNKVGTGHSEAVNLTIIGGKKKLYYLF